MEAVFNNRVPGFRALWLRLVMRSFGVEVSACVFATAAGSHAVRLWAVQITTTRQDVNTCVAMPGPLYRRPALQGCTTPFYGTIMGQLGDNYGTIHGTIYGTINPIDKSRNGSLI